MSKISVTSYRNHSHELRVALTFSGKGFDRILTQDEARELRDRLTHALEDTEDGSEYVEAILEE